MTKIQSHDDLRSHWFQFYQECQTEQTYFRSQVAMESKVAYFLLVASITVTVSCIKYEHISDCLFFDRGLVFGNDNITFVCGEHNNEHLVIVDSEKFNCSNSLFLITNLWIGSINFQNCQMPDVKTRFFKEFINIHSFNISNLELTQLQSDAFREAKNLTRLLVPHNRLVEIPSLLFFNTKKLIQADFSDNIISRVDQMAFVGATGLQMLDLSQNAISKFEVQVFKDLTNLKNLNLSHNKFNAIDARVLPTNLEVLDLSSNNLKTLAEHTFDKLISLKILNLSFNSIVHINVKTFGYLSNLEHLKMRKMNISDIEMGTFKQQYNLISLDLSENELHKLDFKLFSPVLIDLKDLQLAGNHLTNLNGFRNLLFPQLTSLDLRNNQFSCSYLIHFMETVSWEKIRLVIDRTPIDPKEPNVRGMKCNDNDLNETGDDNSAAKYSELISGRSSLNSDQQPINDIKIIKISLVLIFMVMLIYLVFYLVLNRDHISTHIHKPVASYLSSKTQSTRTINVDYSREDI